MNDIFTILPEKGVGNLELGSSKQEVLGYFGNADETTTDSQSGVEVLRWKKGIECVFLEEMKWRLYSISLAHPDAVLAGQKVIGQDQAEILNKLTNDFGQPKLSDESGKVDTETFFMANYETIGMCLWFENSVLSAIFVGVPACDRRYASPAPETG